MNVPLSETLELVGRFAADEKPRLLEVGCGEGELAARLGSEGWKVLGIDVDAARVEKARGRGVNACHADLRTFESEPFDVVLVTHSLHHISPLEAAVERLEKLVLPGGWLLVEEYDHSALTPSAKRWLDERQALLQAEGVLQGKVSRPWEQHSAHEHHHAHTHHGEHHRHAPHAAPEASEQMHSGPQMRNAIEKRFTVHSASRAPYLYRFVSSALVPTERGEHLARLMLAQEREAIDKGQVPAVGLRLAAQPR